MPNFRIAKGLKFALEPHGECVIHSRLTNGELQFIQTSNHEFFSLTEEKFVAGIFDGAIKFIYDESSKSGRKNQFAFSYVEFAPPLLRKETSRRFRYVSEIINKNIENITEENLSPIIKDVAKRIQDFNPPSFTTLYRWHKKYIDSSEDIRSLVPCTSQRGNRHNKLSSDVYKARAIQEIIDEEINIYYLTMERPSVGFVFLYRLYH